MTDPTDETQPHQTGRPADDPASGVDPGFSPPDPAVPSAPGRGPDPGPVPAPSPTSTPPTGPLLRADPNRPTDSGWREPAWFPPRERGRDRRPSLAALVVGLAFIAIGAWYFLDRTLGITMPRLQWSSIWPLILIVIGGLILVRSFQRKA